MPRNLNIIGISYYILNVLRAFVIFSSLAEVSPVTLCISDLTFCRDFFVHFLEQVYDYCHDLCSRLQWVFKFKKKKQEQKHFVHWEFSAIYFDHFYFQLLLLIPARPTPHLPSFQFYVFFFAPYLKQFAHSTLSCSCSPSCGTILWNVVQLPTRP